MHTDTLWTKKCNRILYIFWLICHFRDSRFLHDNGADQISFISQSTFAMEKGRLLWNLPIYPHHYHKLFSFPLWCLAKSQSVCLPASFILWDCAFHRYAKAKGRALNSLSAVLKMGSQSVWAVSGSLYNNIMTAWAVAKCQYTSWSVCGSLYDTQAAIWMQRNVCYWPCA